MPGVSYTTLLIVATMAGVGGGNFASSMTNINAYYPHRLKGWALGINAGGGNLGVPVVQLVGLLMLATVGAGYPRLLVVIYIPLIILAAVGSAMNMNNLSQMSNSKRAMRDVTRDGHTWIISLLYIGTFGSFIGFSFAFGQVLQVQFADIFPTPVKAAYLTFLGPLIGSLIRPVGGSLADKFGGVAGDVRELRGDGGRRLDRVGRVAAAVAAALPCRVRHAVRLQRYRQRVDLQDDPGDLQGQVRHRDHQRRRPGGVDGQVAAARGGADRHRRRDRRLRRGAGEPGFRQSFLATKSADSAYIAFIASTPSASR